MKRKKIHIFAIFFFLVAGFLYGVKPSSAAVGAVCGRALTSGGWMNATCYKAEGYFWGLFGGCPSGTTSIESVSSQEAGGCGSGEACCIGKAEMSQATPATKEEIGEKSYNEQFQNNPYLSNNASNPTTSTSTTSRDPGGLVPCDNCTLCHLVIGFKRIYEFFLKLLFVATMLALTVSGVFYMISSGSKTLTEMAKKALTYSLTAFVIGMGAWILINTVMMALGYQHPYGGRWWEFTCDTTQSAGPVSSGRTITGSGGGGTAQGDGTCGGVAVQQNSSQCNLTSKELDNTLACINQKMSGSVSEKFGNSKIADLFTSKAMAASVVITSLGLNRNPDWQQKCVGDNYVGKDYCSHVQYSCHFGGRSCQGQVNAADLAGGNLSAIAAAAKECNATGTVLYGDADHTNHVHVSVNNAACGCR